MRARPIQELVTKHPYFYGRLWAFEVWDGWYSLLDELALRLAHTDRYAVQVQESVGRLHVRLARPENAVPETDRDEVWSVLEDIESRSSEVCARCGEDGALRVIGGWHTTLCEGCLDEEKTRQACL